MLDDDELSGEKQNKTRKEHDAGLGIVDEKDRCDSLWVKTCNGEEASHGRIQGKSVLGRGQQHLWKSRG